MKHDDERVFYGHHVQTKLHKSLSAGSEAETGDLIA